MEKEIAQVIAQLRAVLTQHSQLITGANTLAQMQGARLDSVQATLDALIATLQASGHLDVQEFDRRLRDRSKTATFLPPQPPGPAGPTER